MKLIIKVLFVIYCFIAIAPAIGQDKEGLIITKRVLSVEDGLSSREVSCAVQDKDGFMWIGTRNGLNLYDGKNFTIYNSKNKGLNSDSIVNIAVDAGNRLYIQYPFTQFDTNGHFNNRIQVLDRNTNSIKPLKEVFTNAPFDISTIFYVKNDETNALNILTYFPFCWWKYDHEKGFTKQFEHKSILKKETASELYYFMEKSVIHTTEAVFLPLSQAGYLVSGGKIIDHQEVRYLQQQNELAYFDQYNTLFRLQKKGAFNTNGYGRVLLRLQDIFKSTLKCRPIANDHSCIVYDQRKGVYLYKEEALVQLFDSVSLTKYNNLFIIQSYKDLRGNLWLCTNYGILEVTVQKKLFDTYFKDLNNKYSNIINTQSRGMAERGDGNHQTLYACIGDIIGNVKDRKGNGTVLSPESGYALLAEHDDVYLGSKSLWKYSPVRKHFQQLFTLPFNYFIWSLYRYSDSIIVVGTDNGIVLFNENTTTYKYLNDTAIHFPRAVNVYKIIRSTTKGLIAIAENGIYCINKQLTITEYYGKEAKDKDHFLPINTIYDLLEDKNGICWIASSGEGLVKWKWNEAIDTHQQKVRFINDKAGFPTTVLYRIEEDEQLNLWIGSYNGLIRFNTIDNTTLIFTEKDGIPSNEFDRISSCKTHDGRLYFGGMNGIVGFDPKDFKNYTDTILVPFKLTGLSVFSAAENKFVDCIDLFKKSKELVLAPGDKLLSINFSLLDYQQRIHRYAYTIEGYNSDWNYTEEGSVRISGLPPGKYTVNIKAQLENGQWNKDEIRVSISVLKAFYMQWWFVVGCIVLALLMGIVLFYYKTNKLQSDKLLLENAVNVRTQELKKIVGEKELLLAEVHHRVKNNLQIISGLLQLQGATMEDITIKTAFKEGQSRINSIALIHQNLYEQETFGTIYFHTFIKGLVGKVAELFENGHRFIGFDIGEEKLLLDINTAVPLGLIVNELVTNAYKYLPEHKTDNFVSIYVTPQKNGEYMLQYRDNGPGLKAGINIKNPTTLGIELIKGLATQLGGRVEYSYQEGSIFTIYFIN